MKIINNHRAFGRLFAATILTPLVVAGLTGPRGPQAAQAAVLQAPAAVAAPDATTGIFVQGTGEVTVKPDIARLTLGVQNQAKEAAQAARENAARTDAVIKAVRAAGVAEADIQTVGYNLNPVYQFGPQTDAQGNARQTLTGYQASNTVQVTVRKIADAGKVLDAAIAAGANNASGISFDIANPAPVRDVALANAMADARRKALVIAKAGGMTGLKLVAVSEGRAPDFPRPVFQEMAMARAADAATPVQPGEQKVTVTVTVRYIDASSITSQVTDQLLTKYPGVFRVP